VAPSSSLLAGCGVAGVPIPITLFSVPIVTTGVISRVSHWRRPSQWLLHGFFDPFFEAGASQSCCAELRGGVTTSPGSWRFTSPGAVRSWVEGVLQKTTDMTRGTTAEYGWCTHRSFGGCPHG
jgi:hypothetical protein